MPSSSGDVRSRLRSDRGYTRARRLWARRPQTQIHSFVHRQWTPIVDGNLWPCIPWIGYKARTISSTRAVDHLLWRDQNYQCRCHRSPTGGDDLRGGSEFEGDNNDEPRPWKKLADAVSDESKGRERTRRRSVVVEHGGNG